MMTTVCLRARSKPANSAMLGVADSTTSEPASRLYLQECFTKTKVPGREDGLEKYVEFAEQYMHGYLYGVY